MKWFRVVCLLGVVAVLGLWAGCGVRFPCGCGDVPSINAAWIECDSAHRVAGQWLVPEREIGYVKYRVLNNHNRIPEQGAIEGGWKWGRTKYFGGSRRVEKASSVFGIREELSKAQLFDLINADMSVLGSGAYFPTSKEMIVLFYRAP